MRILGITDGGDDSAVALVGGGELEAMVEEERFSRIKGSPGCRADKLDPLLPRSDCRPMRERMIAYRPLWAVFWLVILLAGNGGFRRSHQVRLKRVSSTSWGLLA